MLRHFKYWLTMDHAQRIRTHGLRSHLHYVFNFNVDGVVVNLQRELKDLPDLQVPHGLVFRTADLAVPPDRGHWVRLVNSAYPDGAEDAKSAQRHCTAHAFLTGVEVFFLCLDGQPIATVSTGTFRTNPTFGGNARIAVDPSQRGHGLGRTLILFALHHLKRKGLVHAESVITLKREQSLRLHFKLGFHIQPDRSRWNFDVQKRMWPARSIVAARLKRVHRDLHG